jgi:hypothetical protein
MMNVHLLRSKELNIEKYLNVLNLLNQFSGPIRFLPGESAVEIRSLMSRIWENEEDFEKKEERVLSKMFPEPTAEASMIFPHEERYQTWDYFFSKCTAYRRQNNIPAEDHVFLLTDNGNEHNWFGAIGPSNRDYFIQTSGWQYYFGAHVDERFPIAYEVAIWIMRQLMFDKRESILQGVHKDTRGCGNDFCKDKKDIILKMRTADLCPQCMNILESKAISPLMVSQLFGIMDGIRSSMTFRERVRIMRKPSRMELRGYTSRIFLTDLGDLELRFNPKEKTIYLFFLNHPEGVHLTSLQDHRSEIRQLYERFTSQYEQVEIARSIDRLIDPLDNDINVVLSRIKRKLKDAVGEELLEYYHIDGPHGGDKRISIDREFVAIED